MIDFQILPLRIIHIKRMIMTAGFVLAIKLYYSDYLANVTIFRKSKDNDRKNSNIKSLFNSHLWFSLDDFFGPSFFRGEIKAQMFLNINHQPWTMKRFQILHSSPENL